ncbi:hypothetical protein KAR91_84940 [Candidatus Pacearchaeota archaeon]|nr:hypothetical protein [Candidatus Pacearchaeota archaeon]
MFKKIGLFIGLAILNAIVVSALLCVLKVPDPVGSYIAIGEGFVFGIFIYYPIFH